MQANKSQLIKKHTDTWQSKLLEPV